MKIVEINDRSAALTKALLTVWEGSVRATHLFLPEAEIRRIRGGVPQAIAAVERLTVAADEQVAPAAFMGQRTGDRRCCSSPTRHGERASAGRCCATASGRTACVRSRSTSKTRRPSAFMRIWDLPRSAGPNGAGRAGRIRCRSWRCTDGNEGVFDFLPRKSKKVLTNRERGAILSKKHEIGTPIRVNKPMNKSKYDNGHVVHREPRTVGSRRQRRSEWACEGKPNAVIRQVGATGAPPVIRGACMAVHEESARPQRTRSRVVPQMCSFHTCPNEMLGRVCFFITKGAWTG